jgi:hypothetical protein
VQRFLRSKLCLQLLASGAVLAGAVSGGLLVTSGQATASDPPPKLNASPDGGLHDGQKVDVKGRHFKKQTKYTLAECPSNASKLSQCGKTNQVKVTSSSSGTFNDKMKVLKSACPGGKCEIAAFKDSNSKPVATHKIVFAPAPAKSG